jgi:UDP-N-acetylmuramate--alanine ligase
MEEFAVSFGDADSVILLDIYPAGEKPIEGITSQALCEKISKMGKKNIFYAGDREQAVARAAAEAVTGDVILTLGAGDVWKIGGKVLERLNGA